MKVVVTAQFKNGLLFDAVQKCGSQIALARYLNTAAGTIGRWLNFHNVPSFRNPTNSYFRALYETWDKKLVDLIGYGLEEIFPIELEINKMEIRRAAKMQAMLEMPIERLVLAGAMPAPLMLPDEQVGRKEAQEVIMDVVKTLTPREAYVIKHRFGLQGGDEHTLEDIANHWHVTKERIRQIEAKALRKLRHPARAKLLKPSWESAVVT